MLKWDFEMKKYYLKVVRMSLTNPVLMENGGFTSSCRTTEQFQSTGKPQSAKIGMTIQ